MKRRWQYVISHIVFCDTGQYLFVFIYVAVFFFYFALSPIRKHQVFSFRFYSLCTICTRVTSVKLFSKRVVVCFYVHNTPNIYPMSCVRCFFLSPQLKIVFFFKSIQTDTRFFHGIKLTHCCYRIIQAIFQSFDQFELSRLSRNQIDKKNRNYVFLKHTHITKRHIILIFG